MTEAFYLAAIPDTWEILGLKLRPFSLGHVILLHRIESPFIGHQPKGSKLFDDLALAVLICSESYANGIQILHDPGLSKALRSWADSLTGMNRWAVRLRLKKPNLINFEGPASEFSEYIKEHSKIPDYDFNPDDLREVHCPEVQLVKVALMREMGISESEILDRPWGLCLWDYVTMNAQDGKIKMVDTAQKHEARDVANNLLARINSGEVIIPTKENKCHDFD